MQRKINQRYFCKEDATPEQVNNAFRSLRHSRAEDAGAQVRC